MSELETLLIELDNLQKTNYKKLKNNKSSALDRWQKYSLIFAITSLFCSFLGAMFFKYYAPSNKVALLVLLLAVFSLLSVLLFLSCQLLEIRNRNKSMHKMLMCEIEQDKKNIQTLLSYDSILLLEAHQWLLLQANRLQSKISLITDNGNLGLLSLIGLAYGIYQFLITEHVNALSLNKIQTLAIIYPIAFLAGITIGALLVKLKINQIAYKTDILLIAINQK